MPTEITAFLDTNYCLHYALADQTDWRKVLGVENVRLVACLGMIHELDEKKSHSTLSGRAGTWIRLLSKSLAGPQTIRTNVTLEIFTSSAVKGSKESSQGDAAIVSQVQEFKALNPDADVRVVTEDLGMQVRCHAEGLSFFSPDGIITRLPNPSDEIQKENLSLRKQLADEKARLPDIRMVATNGIDPPDKDKIINVRLRKPAISNRLSSLVPKIVDDRNFGVFFRSQQREHSQSKAKDQIEKWAANEDQIEDETGRTFELRLMLKNIGKVPANQVKATLTYPKEIIVAAATTWQLSGTRAKPTGLFQEVWNAIKFVQTRMDDAQFKFDPTTTLPPNLASIRADVFDTFRIDDNKLIFSVDQIAHEMNTATYSLFLTYPSWEQVKRFQAEIHIHGMLPAISQDDLISIVPTIDG
jgi:hypothetical protein